MRRNLPWRLLALSLAGGVAGCASSETVPPASSSLPAGHPATLAIRVTARQYAWTFEYPGGVSSEELHVPTGCEVSLTLTSRDVIHALFIAAFGVREDALPGRESRVSFLPRTPGSHDARCVEFCGPGHHRCGAKVVVHEPDAFERWLVSSKAK